MLTPSCQIPRHRSDELALPRPEGARRLGESSIYNGSSLLPCAGLPGRVCLGIRLVSKMSPPESGWKHPSRPEKPREKCQGLQKDNMIEVSCLPQRLQKVKIFCSHCRDQSACKSAE
ncbi:hypothetical protein TNCV_2596331 [Trichonephila clavipes]|nr:hypothetical protein TNCV_2596331 [Trichonephila clavipes]